MSRKLSAAEYHQIALAEPTEVQLKLYNSWPDFRGFSDATLDPEIAEAVTILSLKASAGSDQVVLLTPLASGEWMLKQIEDVAIRIFQGCPGKHPDRAEVMINAYAALFRKIKMTGRLHQMHAEPPHWVSFGFLADETLPEWMQGRLLTLS